MHTAVAERPFFHLALDFAKICAVKEGNEDNYSRIVCSPQLEQVYAMHILLCVQRGAAVRMAIAHISPKNMVNI